MFNNEDVLGEDHVKQVGENMRAKANAERTEFVEKELDFVKFLKAVQKYHIDTCVLLM